MSKNVNRDFLLQRVKDAGGRVTARELYTSFSKKQREQFDSIADLKMFLSCTGSGHWERERRGDTYCDVFVLGPGPKKSVPVDQDKLIKLLLTSDCTQDQLAGKLKTDTESVGAAIEQLRKGGIYLISQRGDRFAIDRVPRLGDTQVSLRSYKDNTFAFGFIGDTHLCSKYERLDVLNQIYDNYAALGITTVLHAGNWIDGEARFNMHDLLVHGLDQQCQYLADHYPQRPGITTYAITGDDHEGWYGQKFGIDVGKHAASFFAQSGRSDWVNVGFMESFIDLVNANTEESVKLLLMHPGGGSAYAMSYKPQKIIEGFGGGEKPAVLLIGHYHKMSYNLIRNVHAIQVGCFRGATTILMSDGSRRQIRDIRVGDSVISHLGKPRQVIRTYSRLHDGEFISINYGRRGRPDQTISSTPEHPYLVDRANGCREWVEAQDIEAGQTVFVEGARCKFCDSVIPYWGVACDHCNPMDDPEVRFRVSRGRGGSGVFGKTRVGEESSHFKQDILPLCDRLESLGYRVVPVGGAVRPDIIGFRDGEVTAFEAERSTAGLLKFKKAKYDGAAISRYLNRVEWLELTERQRQPRSNYYVDTETGLVGVKVISTERRKPKRPCTVYNFEVEEDNSYIANRVAVHNCTQDQTVFMRKKGLDAHVGGGVLYLRQDPETGAIVECLPQFFNFFVRGYNNGRWSYGGPVRNPVRRAC